MGCSVSGGADQGNEESVTLKYAFYAPAGTHAGQQAEKWAEELDDRTSGNATVELFLGGTLLGANDIFDGVKNGLVDVGLDSPHNDEGRFPFTSVMALPLDIPDTVVGSAVLYDLIEEFEPAEYEGFHIITAFTAEPAFVQTIDKVETAEDLAGMQLRVNGATNVALMEGFGAVPVGMPITEVAQALQTNVVDGYVSSRDVLRDFGLAEAINYYVDYPVGLAGTFVAVMTEDRYAALSDDVKATIDELKPEMRDFAAKYQDTQSVGQALKWSVDEYGLETIELSESQVPIWDKKAEAAVTSWLSAHADADFDAQAVLERARELIAQYSN
ncbi:TRAP-type C4-dicarboxylate transport system substrate-binding protein [Rhodoglobus vestalii]|uniref:TRAP-type C4-dicarboxylate transport system substrate-binding protein n=1 Tax=Rhodoglobus vestalii TaxID=193384 RepID=A0A8H2PY69_9MICO|nr:TRAP transporter substrate-binding protein DctP [Rhodoglobus vestalii]TQO20049.1 TRAP-type C4-dicarboxylate transport system substrate-binding protein [Rhodoglobus vestalii]